RTDAANDAGAFVAEGTSFGRSERIDVERLEHVAEVQPDGAHFDLDFVGRGIGVFHFDPGKTVETARFSGTKFKGRVCSLTRRQRPPWQSIRVHRNELI